MPSLQRPISSLLIANRGEVAIRIAQSAHELGLTTYALYSDNDSTHVSLGRPRRAIKIPSPSTYMDIDSLIQIVKEHQIDAVHPGYGFLSESHEFSRRMALEANCMVVGPGWEVLERTGDKLQAKALAVECEVPVTRAMTQPTNKVEAVRLFAQQVGYPIMIKAVDGGGGRGIRLVRNEGELQNACERCLSESPSRSVFAEQAAVDGFKHIEVQILGDGRGNVKHLWERDCSVQRRFQKIVEVAPAPPVGSRRVMAKVIDSAIRMARKLRYQGVGTWEFLVNWKRRQFFFLEINPRLQVEHTVSECITAVDLVKEQLLIAQGQKNWEDDLRLGEWWEADTPPSGAAAAASIQLRLCAEDPTNNFSLSIGKVTDVRFPSGNGIRVDSHLSHGGSVGTEFDNLMAKIIVTASTWDAAVVKARRALEETSITGVKTNLNLLRAIVADSHFASGLADTTWLESRVADLIEQGEQLGNAIDDATADLPALPSLGGGGGGGGDSSNVTSGSNNNTTVFRKGDAWSLTLEDKHQPAPAATAPHHIKIDKITRNAFPEALVAEVSFTIPGVTAEPKEYKIRLMSSNTTSAAAGSSHRRGDPSNKAHVVLPTSGKLMEVLIEPGDRVEENQVIGFVKQMKMELEIRSPRAGTVAWAIELDDEEAGDDVAEGVLLAELVAENDDKSSSSSSSEVRSKL
ncbi:hypothetical protein DV736_g4576, partial [Chaetothyriales sp. CBS 134916]